MKTRPVFFLPVFLVLCIRGPAQTLPYPAGLDDMNINYGGRHHPPRQIVDGYLVLKTGDTLTGQMDLGARDWFNYQGCRMSEDGKPDRFINARRIAYIRADISSLGRSETTLVTLDVRHPYHAFWRLIGEKGGVSIYDRSEGVFSHKSWKDLMKRGVIDISAVAYNEYMYMVTPEEIIKIYGKFNWSSRTFVVRNRSLDLLVKFINRRYHQTFTNADFVSGMAMIDYILDKENGHHAVATP